MHHPTAIIDPSAQLGDDVHVGPYAIIECDVRIGDRCRIDAHAIVKQYTNMDADNHIYSYALIGGEPQDLKFDGEVSYLHMGSGNKVREFATIHRGTAGGGNETRIGNRNLLMAYTHVAHDCVLGDDIVMSNGATLAGHVHVGDAAIIGGLSAVHQFCRIGDHAFVGGMTGVPQDLPPWMLAAGSRALVYGPNAVGLRRAGASRELLSAFKKAFRLVWWSDLVRADALQAIYDEFSNFKEVVDFIDFIKASERGICPAEKKANKNLDAEPDQG